MKEVRIDAGALRADRRESLVEWVRSLGVNPDDIRPVAVVRDGEHGYELHLSLYVRDENGKLTVDVAADNVVSEPMVIELGTEQFWPRWIGAVE